MDDVPSVGGKNASLGEMIGALESAGIRVPDGFATLADAYWHFLDANRLRQEIGTILSDLDTGNVHELARRGAAIRDMLLKARMPADLEEEIRTAYRQMESEYGPRPSVAVRSSATAEDLPDASFAGQQETYLNVRGEEALLAAIRRVFASLFTDRAISYRVDKGFDHMKVALSVGVQKMVRSDLAVSGVMFSIDTETGFRDAVLITGSYGLGENIVQGTVNPDEFCVFKTTLKEGFRPILSRKLGDKSRKMILSDSPHQPVVNVDVPFSDRTRFCLSDDEVLELARMAMVIEDHYSGVAGTLQPMDIEWAKDGLSGELFIVQARPETIHGGRRSTTIRTYSLQAEGKVLARGKSIGNKIASGRARLIRDVSQLSGFRAGEVLVTDMTDPDWEPVMKLAEAIVTNRGGRTCHAAIIARELGVPAVVGTQTATDVIRDGQPVTVSCAGGETGYVYEGKLPFSVREMNIGELRRPKTRIMMNISNPEQAFGLSFIPNEGVGLARLEFIIGNMIGIHPKALLRFETLEDQRLKAKIVKLSRAYPDPVSFYVQKLAEGVGLIAAAFYPGQVIVRFSDFKTNEYANLLGGQLFEPKEDNPMIGFRGACRYYSKGFRDVFGLECRAIHLAREEMGLTNISVMIPFCRTPDEGRKVLHEMSRHGLERGKNGLSVLVMCETPANITDADRFLDLFDGFSIGSNDLTQLVLGIDRDSELVARLFDERQPAVLEMLRMAISACRRRKKYVGICGQAPSDYPEMAEFLVREGIESISLNPDSVLATTVHILEVEKALDPQ
jgi:pyruvate,water dikinase